MSAPSTHVPNQRPPRASGSTSTSTALCLACASSLPPKLAGALFRTPCCARPICPACIKRSPRLARYDPCLACLSGVRAVGASSISDTRTIGKGKERGEQGGVNVDGKVRDADVWVIGDEDEDEAEADVGAGQVPSTPPPAYSTDLDATQPAASSLPSSPSSSTPGPRDPSTDTASSTSSSSPAKYYLKAGDTLTGLALRFGVDGRALCRLNSLPPSTLSTTPHILHTRPHILLPASAHLPPGASGSPSRDAEGDDAEGEEARKARRAREQAAKRLQVLTKEVDWRVAHAYVALADDPDAAYEHSRKAKEAAVAELGPRAGAPTVGGALEGRAVDAYLDDEEWEARQREEGRVYQRVVKLW